MQGRGCREGDAPRKAKRLVSGWGQTMNGSLIGVSRGAVPVWCVGAQLMSNAFAELLKRAVPRERRERPVVRSEERKACSEERGVWRERPVVRSEE